MSFGRFLGRLWTDRCEVWAWEPYTDPVSGITEHREELIFEDLPCRISYGNAFGSGRGLVRAGDGLAAELSQEIKLILSPDLVIPPGCKIRVHREGAFTDYGRSGEPALYSGHQEICLALWKGWA